MSELAGIPDSFQRLWTPHRMVYIDGAAKPRDAGECPFCVSPRKADAEGLIVHRGEHAFVVMNLFPYNPGHLLVCPYRHVSGYVDATPEETREIAELTQQAISTLQAVSRPAGFNIGMNQGDVAGAGIAMHLHQHVVPRWLGDANFLPIVAQTKAVPQLLEDAREQLAAAWADA
ncbi:HIT domain-containing protein [Tessaracoccus sp. OH4464_COT-324]|uniref:HIT family protein n=1 Tax=Tessaracoccus sp. OH4464_COT-324 TaxID=2491059 RepID=UPI000F64485B|nr:HIT domain-containing protein [Tessaracoccus sp. OH4464_COT-324]RRD48028.1 HIT domain-containing protein [Tessaracoccus sp. OH4464_COT-324]